MKPEKKIPTILGLFVLAAGTLAGIFLTQTKTGFGSKASQNCQPINPQTTNITHHSADISFTTTTSCLSSLFINDHTLKNDSSQKLHYFSVHNLEADTVYPFSLVNSGTRFDQDDYQFKTGQKPTGSTPTSNLAWGRVLNPDLTPAKNAVIYLNINGASLLSAPVTSQGNWNISLGNSFNYQKNAWFTPPDNLEEEITAIAADGSATQIIGNTNHNNPVPDIILGQSQLNGLADQQAPGSIDSDQPQSARIQLTIQNPQDGESISTQRPQFFGSAPQGAQLNITVESSHHLTDSITSSSEGAWTWSPPQNLEPGQHTITVETQGRTVSHRFTVLAQAGQRGDLAFTASPSATLAAIASATAAPTPTPSTSIPTSTPTAIPTTRTSRPSTDSAVPVSGITAPTITLLSLAAFLLASYLFIIHPPYQKRRN